MVVVRGITWDGTGHSIRRSGKIEGREVAKLHKNKNHTHNNDGIWSVEINGQVSSETFRNARQAQEHAADQLERFV